MQTSSFTYNNGDIHYTISGHGDPIIFIHGFSLDRNMWQPQVDFFSKTHQVIMYDARGFGNSSTPYGDYGHVDDLNALLKHLGVKSAHFVGLSLGGRIAINFTLTHPTIVRSLVVMDAALDGYEDTLDWNVHAKEAGIEQAKKNWLNHEIFAPTVNNPSANAILQKIIDNYSGWHWLNTNPQQPASTNAHIRLNEITVPTLVLVGDKDLEYFKAIADTIATGIKSAQKVSVPNAGHMINIEAPETVNRLVADFIAHAL